LIGADERRFYDLFAWVVMRNHIHLLILSLVSVPVLMRWLKGSTARGANRILSRPGQPFWQDESFEHYLRAALGAALALVQCRMQAEPPAPPTQPIGKT
jgi:REP element-mobilizing transposase RayT